MKVPEELKVPEGAEGAGRSCRCRKELEVPEKLEGRRSKIPEGRDLGYRRARRGSNQRFLEKKSDFFRAHNL